MDMDNDILVYPSQLQFSIETARATNYQGRRVVDWLRLEIPMTMRAIRKERAAGNRAKEAFWISYLARMRRSIAACHVR